MREKRFAHADFLTGMFFKKTVFCKNGILQKQCKMRYRNVQTVLLSADCKSDDFRLGLNTDCHIGHLCQKQSVIKLYAMGINRFFRNLTII